MKMHNSEERASSRTFANCCNPDVWIHRPKLHNIRSATSACSSKVKMSALSKVEMSVSTPFWEFGGCHFDGHGGDEQARAEAMFGGRPSFGGRSLHCNSAFRSRVKPLR